MSFLNPLFGCSEEEEMLLDDLLKDLDDNPTSDEDDNNAAKDSKNDSKESIESSVDENIFNNEYEELEVEISTADCTDDKRLDIEFSRQTLGWKVKKIDRAGKSLHKKIKIQDIVTSVDGMGTGMIDFSFINNTLDTEGRVKLTLLRNKNQNSVEEAPGGDESDSRMSGQDKDNSGPGLPDEEIQDGDLADRYSLDRVISGMASPKLNSKSENESQNENKDAKEKSDDDTSTNKKPANVKTVEKSTKSDDSSRLREWWSLSSKESKKGSSNDDEVNKLLQTKKAKRKSRDSIEERSEISLAMKLKYPKLCNSVRVNLSNVTLGEETLKNVKTRYPHISWTPPHTNLVEKSENEASNNRKRQLSPISVSSSISRKLSSMMNPMSSSSSMMSSSSSRKSSSIQLTTRASDSSSSEEEDDKHEEFKPWRGSPSPRLESRVSKPGPVKKKIQMAGGKKPKLFGDKQVDRFQCTKCTVKFKSPLELQYHSLRCDGGEAAKNKNSLSGGKGSTRDNVAENALLREKVGELEKLLQANETARFKQSHQIYTLKKQQEQQLEKQQQLDKKSEENKERQDNRIKVMVKKDKRIEHLEEELVEKKENIKSLRSALAKAQNDLELNLLEHADHRDKLVAGHTVSIQSLKDQIIKIEERHEERIRLVQQEQEERMRLLQQEHNHIVAQYEARLNSKDQQFDNIIDHTQESIDKIVDNVATSIQTYDSTRMQPAFVRGGGDDDCTCVKTKDLTDMIQSYNEMKDYVRNHSTWSSEEGRRIFKRIYSEPRCVTMEQISQDIEGPQTSEVLSESDPNTAKTSKRPRPPVPGLKSIAKGGSNRGETFHLEDDGDIEKKIMKEVGDRVIQDENDEDKLASDEDRFNVYKENVELTKSIRMKNSQLQALRTEVWKMREFLKPMQQQFVESKLIESQRDVMKAEVDKLKLELVAKEKENKVHQEAILTQKRNMKQQGETLKLHHANFAKLKTTITNVDSYSVATLKKDLKIVEFLRNQRHKLKQGKQLQEICDTFNKLYQSIVEKEKVQAQNVDLELVKILQWKNMLVQFALKEVSIAQSTYAVQKRSLPKLVPPPPAQDNMELAGVEPTLQNNVDSSLHNNPQGSSSAQERPTSSRRSSLLDRRILSAPSQQQPSPSGSPGIVQRTSFQPAKGPGSGVPSNIQLPQAPAGVPIILPTSSMPIPGTDMTITPLIASVQGNIPSLASVMPGTASIIPGTASIIPGADSVVPSTASMMSSGASVIPGTASGMSSGLHTSLPSAVPRSGVPTTLGRPPGMPTLIRPGMPTSRGPGMPTLARANISQQRMPQLLDLLTGAPKKTIKISRKVSVNPEKSSQETMAANSSEDNVDVSYKIRLPSLKRPSGQKATAGQTRPDDNLTRPGGPDSGMFIPDGSVEVVLEEPKLKKVKVEDPSNSQIKKRSEIKDKSMEFANALAAETENQVTQILETESDPLFIGFEPAGPDDDEGGVLNYDDIAASDDDDYDSDDVGNDAQEISMAGSSLDNVLETADNNQINLNDDNNDEANLECDETLATSDNGTENRRQDGNISDQTTDRGKKSGKGVEVHDATATSSDDPTPTTNNRDDVVNLECDEIFVDTDNNSAERSPLENKKSGHKGGTETDEQAKDNSAASTIVAATGDDPKSTTATDDDSKNCAPDVIISDSVDVTRNAGTEKTTDDVVIPTNASSNSDTKAGDVTKAANVISTGEGDNKAANDDATKHGRVRSSSTDAEANISAPSHDKVIAATDATTEEILPENGDIVKGKAAASDAEVVKDVARGDGNDDQDKVDDVQDNVDSNDPVATTRDNVDDDLQDNEDEDEDEDDVGDVVSIGESSFPLDQDSD